MYSCPAGAGATLLLWGYGAPGVASDPLAWKAERADVQRALGALALLTPAPTHIMGN